MLSLERFKIVKKKQGGMVAPAGSSSAVLRVGREVAEPVEDERLAPQRRLVLGLRPVDSDCMGGSC